MIFEGPLLVCGFGRCGSSMVMQMLFRGGTPCVGDWPAFEDQNCAQLPVSASWLGAQAGKAVKVLDPLRFLSKLPKSSRVIWLDRDAKSQSKSQVNFIKHLMPIDVPNGAWKKIAASYRADRKATFRYFERHSVAVLALRFEDILRDPMQSAYEIERFSGARVDYGAVLARQPEWSGSFLIEEHLLQTTPTVKR